MSTLYTGSGTPINLNRELGRGGEGTIFTVNGRDGVVAKVYHEPVPAKKARKLEVMAADRTDELDAVSAWPMDTLHFGRGGPVRGLVMPLVEAHKEAHVLYNPRSRRVEFERANYRFLVHVAANIARAIAVVHAHGHVVGDVNHSGILVSGRGTVRLIDCDSFQVQSGGEVFRCEVGVPEYTPPELQGRVLADVQRTKNHDSFGLAVMVFHLLFMGRHPYAGQYRGRGHMPISKAIKEGRFAYGPAAPSRGMLSPPFSPKLDSVPAPVQSLFISSFTKADRPTAAEWVSGLEAYGKALRTCADEPQHVYWSGLRECPWCEIETTSGVLLFPVQLTLSSGESFRGGVFDIHAVWKAIESLEGQALTASGPHMALPSAQAIELRGRRARWKQEVAGTEKRLRTAFGAAGVILVVATVYLILGFGSLWALVTALTGWWALVEGRRWSKPDPKPVRSRVREMERRAGELKRNRDQLNQTLHRLGTSAFDAKLSELRSKRDELRQLDNREKQAIKELHDDLRTSQLELYLSRYPIARCSVEGVGSGRKQMLASYGVATAADVTRRKVYSIPGFGQELTRRMVAWRDSLERRFVFDPSKRVDPASVARVRRRFEPERRRLQSALIQGPRELSAARAHDSAKRGTHIAKLNQVMEELAQLEADLGHIMSGA